MSKQTTFQELRHECAKKYCPSNWTLAIWTDFYGDCMNLLALNEHEKQSAIIEIMDCYRCSNNLIKDVTDFQQEHHIL